HPPHSALGHYIVRPSGASAPIHACGFAPSLTTTITTVRGCGTRRSRAAETGPVRNASITKSNRNSYPTLVENQPGEWIAVWDSSNEPDKKRTAIRFGRLRLEN